MSDSLTIERTALDQLAELLLERAGLKITPDGYYGLRLALLARMPALSLSDASDYVRRLRQRAGEHELRALLPLVTVGKTEFFRDQKQFLAFEKTVFPKVLANARKERRPVRLWSAGCATGEEPYSLACVALEQGALPQDVSIWATDLNPVAIENAAAGFFPTRRLIGLSESRLARFFRSHESGYQASEVLKQFIHFEGQNLAAPVWSQVAPATFDVIFCRNVIIYFDQPTIEGVMGRFHDALRSGGWLFLGYSESLFKVRNKFEMIEVDGVFLYRRPRKHIETTKTSLTSGSGSHPKFVPSAPPSQSGADLPPVRVDESKLPELKADAARAEEPKAAPMPFSSSSSVVMTPAQLLAMKPSPPARLDEVVAAIDASKFDQALSLAKKFAADFPDDLTALLMLGNVHALLGELDAAREAYNAALAREALCVEARVYLALAAMQVGQADEARRELTRVLFLEPTLVLGHYLMGQVHELRGDADGARRSYRNAIAHRKSPPHELVAHFPDLPGTNEGICQAAQYRLAALSER